MKSIDVISIPVSDQQVSKHFYSMLGFSVLEESDLGGGRWWIRMGLNGSSTSITLVTWFSKMVPGSIQGISLRTDNLEGDAALLKTQGIPISRIENAPTGRFFSFKDPDGNGWSFFENRK